MATLFAFNRFISSSVLVACVISVYLAIEIKSGGIDIRNLMREAWPLPRSVVLHDVGVFGPDSGMYKFHTDVADVAAFGDLLHQAATIDKPSSEWNSINLMKYASGCYADTAYVTTGTPNTLPTYSNAVPGDKTDLPGRSVCTCLTNIQSVMSSNITVAAMKNQFAQWVNELDTADNNFIVMKASDALNTENAEYKELESQALVFNALSKSDKSKFIAKASERCFLSSQPQYVMQYGGQLDTKIVIFNGIMLLVFAMLGSVFKFPSEQPAADNSNKEYFMLWAVSLCYYVYFILALIWTFNKSLREHVFGSTVPLRYDDKNTAFDNHVAPGNHVQALYDSVVLLVLGLMSFLFASQQLEQTLSTDNKSYAVRWFRKIGSEAALYLPNADNLIWKCVQNDLPYIVGYASIGLGLLVANGLTQTNSIMFAWLLLLTIGLVQHVSNVNKIVYDALCQNTSETAMQKLTNPNDSQKPTAMQANLMYFGWTRLLWFLTMVLLTVVVLTFTRAAVDVNEFTGFLNSHLFWFVFALFWANVGYDVLRELLPFQFETTPSNQHKVIITATYVLYLCWSLAGLMQQIAHTKHSRHLYAH